MQEKLNTRLFVLLLVIAAALSGGWYFLHKYQMRGHAAELLNMASTAEARGRLDRAARFVGLYLNFAGGDTEARIRYGNLLKKQARTAKALHQVFQVYEQVLQDQPDNHALRRQAIDIGLALGLFDDTLWHVERLHKTFPEDGTLDYQRGLCLQGQGKDKEAAEAYQAAVKHAPAKVEAYQQLAYLFRQRLDQPGQAKKVMHDLVVANPRSFKAHYARAVHLHTYGLAGTEEDIKVARQLAEEDVKVAYQLAPDDFDVLLISAKVALEQGRLEEARGFLRHAPDKQPEERQRLYMAWAALETMAGQPSEAVSWLRRGVKDFPGDTELNFQLADLLLETGQFAEAQAVILEMSRLKLNPAQVDFLQARQHLAQSDNLPTGGSKWVKAIQKLEATRPLLRDRPDLSVRAALLLAECYGQLGDAERQMSALRQATTADPQSARAGAELASALARLGRLDEALEHFQRMRELPRVPVDLSLNIARLELLRNLRLPPEQRRWENIEHALASADKQMPDSVQVPLLRAEVLRARGKNSEAHQLLEATRDRYSQQLEPWLALAAVADRDGKAAEVQRLLAAAEKALGSGPQAGNKRAVDLVLARLYFARSEKDLPVVRGAESKAADLKSSTDDRVRLLRGAAAAYLALGKEADARRVWQEVAKLQPHDYQLRLLLFELALRAGDKEGMQVAIDNIEELESGKGPMVRYVSACRLLWQAREEHNEEYLAQARPLLAEVAARRPTWSQVHLVQGEIDELDGKPDKDKAKDKALDHYLRAIELGDRQPQVIRHVAELLFERQRFAEADQVFRKLLDDALATTELQKLGAMVSLRALDKERALKLAQRAVPASSKEFRDYIWKGRLLGALDRPEEAEAALRRAVQLKEDLPDPWIALVQYYAATGQRKKAEDALLDAQKKLTGDGAALALAQGYGLLGQASQAEEYYVKALAAQPESGTVMRQVAGFFVQNGQRQKAMPLLRRLIRRPRQGPDEDLLWARRQLALLLIVDGTSADFAEAKSLLEENEKAAPRLREEDQFILARVLASRPDYVKEATKIFEEVAQKQPLNANQKFFLAQMYQIQNNVRRARELMFGALTADSQNPLYLMAYARWLLQQQEVAEAKVWIDRLKQQQPKSFEVLALEARALAMRERGADALRLVEEFTAVPKETAERARLAAQLLDSLSRDIPAARATFVPAAEKYYRQWMVQIKAAQSPKSDNAEAPRPGKGPYPELLLADFLGRQDRRDEALALCAQVGATAPPRLVIAVALGVLTGVSKDDPRLSKVEQWIHDAVASKGDRLAALTEQLAVLRDFQGRFADAEHLYRQALQQDPRSERGLNNLAYLLALEGKSDEALQLVQQRMQLTGPFGAALDTRATVFLAQGQYREAIQDLWASVATDATATRYYHLAVAYDMGGNQQDARKALGDAKRLGFQVQRLHLLEQPRCQELLGKLGL
jgi:cellulose synthase operon protein C